MAVDPRHNSGKLLEGPDRVVARAMMKAVGFTDESLARPQIGIAHCWIGTMACNRKHRELAAYAADGVRAAGGTPIEVNTIATNDGITTGTFCCAQAGAVVSSGMATKASCSEFNFMT